MCCSARTEWAKAHSRQSWVTYPYSQDVSLTEVKISDETSSHGTFWYLTVHKSKPSSDLTVRENLLLGMDDASGFDTEFALSARFFPLASRSKQRAGTLSVVSKMPILARSLIEQNLSCLMKSLRGCNPPLSIYWNVRSWRNAIALEHHPAGRATYPVRASYRQSGETFWSWVRLTTQETARSVVPPPA